MSQLDRYFRELIFTNYSPHFALYCKIFTSFFSVGLPAVFRRSVAEGKGAWREALFCSLLPYLTYSVSPAPTRNTWINNTLYTFWRHACLSPLLVLSFLDPLHPLILFVFFVLSFFHYITFLPPLKSPSIPSFFLISFTSFILFLFPFQSVTFPFILSSLF